MDIYTPAKAYQRLVIMHLVRNNLFLNSWRILFAVLNTDRAEENVLNSSAEMWTAVHGVWISVQTNRCGHANIFLLFFI